MSYDKVHAGACCITLRKDTDLRMLAYDGASLFGLAPTMAARVSVGFFLIYPEEYRPYPRVCPQPPPPPAHDEAAHTILYRYVMCVCASKVGTHFVSAPSRYSLAKKFSPVHSSCPFALKAIERNSAGSHMNRKIVVCGTIRVLRTPRARDVE